MLMWPCSRRVLVGLLFMAWACVSIVGGTVVPYLQQSFFFDWNPPAQPYPIPVTAQCDTLHIVWSRGTAQGPNNVPPYYLQIYTSLYTVPIVIAVGDTLTYDWPVPFPPGTIYQICMFDKNGNTGGCQATYTVIPSNSTATCANVTLPPQLDVEGTVANGPISQYGWIDQCTDIEVLPKNGTPPYTFTIAPSLHPPFNITSPTASAMNWTVNLSWASPFFISVVDSAGNMWANGLLHSGGPGKSTACLSGNATANASSVKPVIAIGAGVGGLGVGLLVGLVSTFLFMRRKSKRKREDRFLDLASSDHGSHHLTVFNHSSQYQAVPSTPMGALLDNSMGSNQPPSTLDLRTRNGGNHVLQYHVEPFVMPSEDGRLANEATSPSSMRPNRAESMEGGPVNSRAHNAVYVVHHDSNVAPVTIYHEEGTQIVELPPRYPTGESPARTHSDSRSEGRSASDSRSDGGRTDVTEAPAFLQQNRRPTQVRKPARETAYTNPQS